MTVLLNTWESGLCPHPLSDDLRLSLTIYHRQTHISNELVDSRTANGTASGYLAPVLNARYVGETERDLRNRVTASGGRPLR